MIQEIAPRTYFNQFQPRDPKEEDFVFCFRGRELLLREEQERLHFPHVKDFREQDNLKYLFRIDDRSCFLWYGDTCEPFNGYDYQNLNLLRQKGPQVLEFAGMTAYHLAVWYRDNTYCGRCGSLLGFSEEERAMVCTHCGNTIYPKICPAVIVGVTDGSRIVVTRYAGRAYKGYALIAGFCEIGETAEETVRREVMEEVGLKVKNIRYYASQPWGFESDLLLGFFAEADGDLTIHRDSTELAVAEWVDRNDLAPNDNTLSLTSEMIEAFRQGVFEKKEV